MIGETVHTLLPLDLLTCCFLPLHCPAFPEAPCGSRPSKLPRPAGTGNGHRECALQGTRELFSAHQRKPTDDERRVPPSLKSARTFTALQASVQVTGSDETSGHAWLSSAALSDCDQAKGLDCWWREAVFQPPLHSATASASFQPPASGIQLLGCRIPRPPDTSQQ